MALYSLCYPTLADSDNEFIHDFRRRPDVRFRDVATSIDVSTIKQLCDDLNTSGVCISGRLEAVTVCEFDGKAVADLERMEFTA